jgi:hypothetical protein
VVAPPSAPAALVYSPAGMQRSVRQVGSVVRVSKIQCDISMVFFKNRLAPTKTAAPLAAVARRPLSTPLRTLHRPPTSNPPRRLGNTLPVAYPTPAREWLGGLEARDGTCSTSGTFPARLQEVEKPRTAR